MQIVLVKRAEDAPADGERSVNPIALGIGGALIGSAVGHHLGGRGRDGLQLGTRLKGLSLRLSAKYLRGGTRRAAALRNSRLMMLSPKRYHARKGAVRGALYGGAAGLGTGIIGRSLKKESSMRFVIVKEAGLPLPLVKARNVVSHAMHGGERAQRMAQVPTARYLRGVRPTAGAGFSAGAYEPAGLQTNIIRPFPRVPGSGGRMLDKLTGKTVTASEMRAGGPMRYVIVKKAVQSNDDDPSILRGAALGAAQGAGTGATMGAIYGALSGKGITRTALHGAAAGGVVGGIAGAGVTAGMSKHAPFKSRVKTSSHCPPETKKKVLLKHHFKDLGEAVKDKDQNYAKRTAKDIEEIAADKHASFAQRMGRGAGLYAGAAPQRARIAKLESEVEKLKDPATMKAAQEQFADELDMLPGVEPQFLNEAPEYEDPIVLEPLSPKLAYDQGGLKIRIDDDIVESMLKIAAVQLTLPFMQNAARDEAQMIFSGIGTGAPSGALNAAHDAAKATAQLTQAPLSVKEQLGRSFKNLGGTFRDALTGEGPRNRKTQAIIALGLVGGAALGLRHLYKKRQAQRQYDRVLNAVMDDPHFRNVEQKEDKVPEAYSFLRRYAPTLAMDPIIARSFVRQAIESDVSWMNQTVAQGLAEAESKHLDANRSRKELRDLMSHPLVAPFGGRSGGSESK